MDSPLRKVNRVQIEPQSAHERFDSSFINNITTGCPFPNTSRFDTERYDKETNDDLMT